LATSGTDRDLKIYEVESGKLKATIDSKEAGFSGKMGFNAFSFSPDGHFYKIRKTRFSRRVSARTAVFWRRAEKMMSASFGKSAATGRKLSLC